MKQIAAAAAAARDLTFRRVVDIARRAPSVHNTQPWTWSIHGDALELYADRTRALEASDPDGRNLAMSCGCALHHALVATRALGWTPVVDTLPDPRDPDLLARIRPRPADIPVDAVRWLDAIDARCTDRRRFTSWPIPDERLQELSSVTRSLGATAVPILDHGTRLRLEHLVDRAMRMQGQDLRVRMEERAWIGHSTADGLIDPAGAPWGRATPAAGVPASIMRPRIRPRGTAPRRDRSTAPTEGAGRGHGGRRQTLVAPGRGGAERSVARRHHQGPLGRSAGPVVEVPDTRHRLEALLETDMHPQILLRVGWQEIGRGDVDRTTRRPLADVLRAVHRTGTNASAPHRPTLGGWRQRKETG